MFDENFRIFMVLLFVISTQEKSPGLLNSNNIFLRGLSLKIRLKYFEIKSKSKMATKNEELEMFTFDQIKDEFIGEAGSEKRTQYEQELQLELMVEIPLKMLPKLKQ